MIAAVLYGLQVKQFDRIFVQIRLLLFRAIRASPLNAVLAAIIEAPCKVSGGTEPPFDRGEVVTYFPSRSSSTSSVWIEAEVS